MAMAHETEAHREQKEKVRRCRGEEGNYGTRVVRASRAIASFRSRNAALASRPAGASAKILRASALKAGGTFKRQQHRPAHKTVVIIALPCPLHADRLARCEPADSVAARRF
eukprot:344296-Rhodomonas_salina.2